MQQPISAPKDPMKIIGLSLVVLVGLGLIVGIWTLVPDFFKITPPTSSTQQVVAFTSTNDLRTYLETAKKTFPTTGSFVTRDSAEIGLPALNESKDVTSGLSATSRFIGTNVQVGGLDEPDVMKSDGRGIYVGQDMVYAIDLREGTSTDGSGSRGTTVPTTVIDNIKVEEQASVSEPVSSNPPMINTGSADGEVKAVEANDRMETSTEPATSIGSLEPDIDTKPLPNDSGILPMYETKTRVVDVRTPSGIVERTAIKEQGEMLIDGTSLVFLQGTGLKAYNVADPTTPKATWSYTLPDNASIVTARATDGEIILITQQVTSTTIGCPMPVLKGEQDAAVACAAIYHPIDPAPVTAIYTVVRINTTTGTVTGTVATTGTQYVSTVMVSAKAAYLTYPETTDPVSYELDILRSLGSILPTSVRTRLTTIDGYDLSAESTVRELQLAIDEYRRTLTTAEATAFDKKITDARTAYDRDHLRDTMKTGIIKIQLDPIQVTATGSVPGNLLNQYSLDEYKGVLRVATTVGQSWWGTSTESVNDVYTLDSRLRQLGAVRDLGRGERIYSVRFVGQQGYVVTFKQVDPFYVIDLSDPNRPNRVGELKIPGYSSYLHPLSDTLILGIGQDGNEAKATMFDVSTPADPRAVATVALPGGWSEVQSNPRAFLHDAKHSAVFIPAGTTGVILRYTNTSLSVQTTLNSLNARRAFVIDDRMMVVGTSGVAVIKESDWSIEQRLTFSTGS